MLTNSSGRWEVIVDGIKQTSARYSDMTADAFAHASEHIKPSKVRRALMLGLAGGGAVASLYSAFPNASLVAVEYDPEMIAIARELKLYDPHPEPEILEADAWDAIREFAKQGRAFDLIFLDIFCGQRLSPLTTNGTFLADLQRVLEKGGLLVVNVSGQKNALLDIKKSFPRGDTWTYDLNHFGAFWE